MFWPRLGVALLVLVTMLQCPRCSLPLTVAHCRAGPAPAPCCDPAPAPRLYPAPLLQQVQETRAEEERIAAELQSLHIRVLQNQLQAAKLQQQLASSQLPPPVSSCAASPDPDTTEAVLARCRAQLAECGWYHGRLSWQQSRALLAAAEEGTFLVRDSQDPRFLYSLSLARAPEDDGPTSIRILFARGKFSLDADERIPPAPAEVRHRHGGQQLESLGLPELEAADPAASVRGPAPPRPLRPPRHQQAPAGSLQALRPADLRGCAAAAAAQAAGVPSQLLAQPLAGASCLLPPASWPLAAPRLQSS